MSIVRILQVSLFILCFVYVFALISERNNEKEELYLAKLLSEIEMARTKNTNLERKHQTDIANLQQVRSELARAANKKLA